MVAAKGLPQMFDMNEISCKELEGLNRKYSNFSGHFVFADFSAMFFHLISAFSQYCLSGDLTWVQYRVQLNILSLEDPLLCQETSLIFTNKIEIFCWLEFRKIKDLIKVNYFNELILFGKFLSAIENDYLSKSYLAEVSVSINR